MNYQQALKFLWPYHTGIKVMRAKSLKSSQILRAHMPYFCKPGHNLCYVATCLTHLMNTIHIIHQQADVMDIVCHSL